MANCVFRFCPIKKPVKLSHRLFDLDFFDFVVEGDDFVAVLEEHPVPGVDLGGLVDEHLLQILQLQGPLVDVLLQLSEGHVPSCLSSC